jgi:hypothetical protein
MLCKNYGIHTYKPTLSKPGLGQGFGPGDLSCALIGNEQSATPNNRTNGSGRNF